MLFVFFVLFTNIILFPKDFQRKESNWLGIREETKTYIMIYLFANGSL